MNDWVYKLPDYRKAVKVAMKLWRRDNPDRSPHTRVIVHGFYGHCLWNTERDAGVLCTVSDVLTHYRSEIE